MAMDRRDGTYTRKTLSWPRILFRRALLAPGIFVLLALLALGAAGYETAQLIANRHALPPVQALILDRDARDRAGGDGSPVRQYFQTIEYAPTPGDTQRITVPVSQLEYEAYEPGRRRNLWVAPDEPRAVSFAAPAGRAGGVRDALVMAAVFVGVAVLMGLPALRELPSAARAARGGEVREARVLAHRIEVIERRRPGRYRPPIERCRFDWVDATGQTGVSRVVPRARLPAVGAVVVVFIDPATGNSWWEGDY